MMGDLLASSPLPRPVKIPGRPGEAGIVKSKDNCNVSGMVQKIVLLREWLAIGWAGSMLQAATFIRFLDERTPKNKCSIVSLFGIINSYSRSDFSQLDVIVMFGSKKEFSVFEINHEIGRMNVDPFQVGDLNCYCIGSGVPDFYNKISDFVSSEALDGAPSRADIDESIAISFMCTNLFRNYAPGGFESGWGGGFEIVSPGVRGSFKKLDKILITFSAYDSFGLVRSSENFIFQYYEGSNLVIININVNDGSEELHLITPPNRTTVRPRFNRISKRVNYFVHVSYPESGGAVIVRVQHLDNSKGPVRAFVTRTDSHTKLAISNEIISRSNDELAIAIRNL